MRANNTSLCLPAGFTFVRLCVVAPMLFICIAALSAVPLPSNAADSIVFVEKSKVWVLQTREATYAFGVNERGELQNMYWGKHVRAEDFSSAHSVPGWSSFDLSTTTTPQEYPGWGAGLNTEPALKVSFSNGNRGVVLHYVEHQLKNDDLEITLKDEVAQLFVHLHYRVYADNGILERSARIENRTQEVVTVENAQSAAWTLPPDRSYRVHYLTGRWAGEWQLQTQLLQIGKAGH